MTGKSTTTISELSRAEVNTWSEDWRHEYEVRAVLAMSKEERDAFFHGVEGDRSQRRIVVVRGQEVADRVYEDVKPLKAIRENQR